MGLEWLGKHRTFTEKLMKFGNAYARSYNDEKRTPGVEIQLSSAQIQILECIMENQDQDINMASLSAKLGMTASAFSKNIKKLTDRDLIERYQKSTNRKDIIIKVSELGQNVYEQYTRHAMAEVFSDMFVVLDDIPDEYVEKFEEILVMAANATQKPNLPTLIKL